MRIVDKIGEAHFRELFFFCISRARVHKVLMLNENDESLTYCTRFEESRDDLHDKT